MMDVQQQSQQVGKFFSDFSETWDTLYGGKRNLFWRKFDDKFRRDVYERYELTMQALGDHLDGKRVLDIGCGSGIYCFEVVKRGGYALGIDVAPNMVQLCKDRAKELGISEKTDFFCTPFPQERKIPALEETYDYGIVMGVMDYLENPRDFLKALRERVKGTAVISFPFAGAVRYPIRKYRYKLLGRCPIYHYTKQEMESALRDAGYTRFDVQFLTHSGGCFIVKAHS